MATRRVGTGPDGPARVEPPAEPMRRWSAVVEGVHPVALIATSVASLRVRPEMMLQAGCALLAVTLWLAGLPGVELGRMNDLGLISVMSPGMLLAPVLLTAAFLLGLRAAEPGARSAGLLVVVLVVMLYGLPAMVEAVPRFAVTWTHAGLVEYITRTGTVAPALEARFDWPGFFVLGGLVTRLAGLSSVIQIAAWAPVYFNLLYSLPLLLIFRSATTDQRHVWAAMWVFYLTNWVGQDYFSPQGLNYFFYLVILAVALTWLRLPGFQMDSSTTDQRPLARLLTRFATVRRSLSHDAVPSRASLPWQHAGLVAVLLLIFAAVTSSHQLTPFFVLVALTALALLRRVDLVGLPVLFAVMVAAWLTYVAEPFLAGHLGEMLSEVGQLGGTVSTNVAARFAGSAEHQFVVTLRVVLAVGVWGLSGIGWLRRARAGRSDLTMAVLLVAPFPLVALQAYGGELVLRMFLFSLPFACFLAVSLLFDSSTPESARSGPAVARLDVGRFRAVAAVGLSVVVSLTFLITRYGNERVDYMTQAEVDAVSVLYQDAPAGSLLVAASNNLPWKFQDFEQYDYIPVTDEVLIGNVDAIVGLMQQAKYPQAFLILTRSEEAYAEMFTGLATGAWDQFVAQVEASPRLRLLYSNTDAQVFELVR
jgi:hypothetical protein